MPWTLARFFYNIDQGHQCYTRVTGEHLTLSFLPFTLDNVAISDIYNGLILYWCEGLMYYTAMSFAIQQPRSSRNYSLASILLLRLD
jgi:hypothetical protein